jgi:hypothetical protein
LSSTLSFDKAVKKDGALVYRKQDLGIRGYFRGGIGNVYLVAYEIGIKDPHTTSGLAP